MILKKTNFTVAQADMLNVVIFPSPLLSNNYTLKTKALATLKFNYELRDFAGKLLYTANYLEEKGHETKRTIKVQNIPKGIMLHRFIFKDGSVKTIQTIKN